MATAVPRRIPNFFLYGEAPRAGSASMLHVETIEHRSAPRHWKIRPHIHCKLHQLIFVTRGRGVSLAEGAAVEYAPPALVIVPSGTVHGFDFEPGTHGFVVSMTDDLPREAARREPGISELFESAMTLELPRDGDAVADLGQCFSMLMREFGEPRPGRSLALEGLLRAMLVQALRLPETCRQRAERAVAPRRRLVSRFRELVERGFCESLTLADYAAALGVSQSRLRNACLDVADQSPMQIVHGRILLEAKRELLYTSKSVSEIAYAIGFDDPAYFTRFFSQRTGTSPSKFRSGSARRDVRHSL